MRINHHINELEGNVGLRIYIEGVCVSRAPQICKRAFVSLLLQSVTPIGIDCHCCKFSYIVYATWQNIHTSIRHRPSYSLNLLGSTSIQLPYVDRTDTLLIKLSCSANKIEALVQTRLKFLNVLCKQCSTLHQYFVKHQG